MKITEQEKVAYLLQGKWQFLHHLPVSVCLYTFIEVELKYDWELLGKCQK